VRCATVVASATEDSLDVSSCLIPELCFVLTPYQYESLVPPPFYFSSLLLIIPCANSQKGALQFGIVIEMQNRRLFKASITSLLSLSLGKLASAPPRKLREQASEPSHTLRRGSGRGSRLAPGARHTFTSLQTERRPGSTHCQTPEGTQKAAHKRERTAPTVSLTNTTKTPQLSS
jgi:hypothetical protein